jgi:hypothetical protein
MADEPESALTKGRTVDWTLFAAITTLASLTVFIPVPLLDTVVETWLRRRLVLGLASRRGVVMEDDAVKALADPPSAGCRGCAIALVLWPIKKLFKSALAFLLVKDMADISADMLHRGLLYQEAFDRGWLPGDTAKVRAAIDRTVERFHVKPVERAIWGRFRHEDTPWREQIGRVTSRHKIKIVAGDPVSPALAALDRVPGLLPELLHQFHVEMGLELEGETGLPGLIEPELLPPELRAEKKPELLPLEEALEVPTPPPSSPDKPDGSA